MKIFFVIFCALLVPLVMYSFALYSGTQNIVPWEEYAFGAVLGAIIGLLLPFARKM